MDTLKNYEIPSEVTLFHCPACENTTPVGFLESKSARFQCPRCGTTAGASSVHDYEVCGTDDE